jgi:hypothetical protein
VNGAACTATQRYSHQDGLEITAKNGTDKNYKKDWLEQAKGERQGVE